MKTTIYKLYEKGFFHIISSDIINKIVQFCSGILLVRILSKTNFGIFTYVQNILAIFLLINGFGITAGLLQYGLKAKNKKERQAIFKYAIRIAILANLFIMISILLYCYFGTFKIETGKNLLKLMSGFPLLSIVIEIIYTKLRVNIENKRMSYFSNIRTIVTLIFMVLGAYYWQLSGLIIGKYLGYITIIIFFRKELREFFLESKENFILTKKFKKEIKKYSFVSMLNNAISQILYIIDIFLIGKIIGDENILASYKTATLIPLAMAFIPSSIMIYVYPEFVKIKDNKELVKTKYLRILKYLSIFNLIISICLILFSKYIIMILFGKKYFDSILPFIILSFGYFFSGTFRIPSGNILVMLEKLKFNFYDACFCGILNIVFDIYLINNFGSIGAAISTTTIFIISGITGNIFLYYTLREKKVKE